MLTRDQSGISPLTARFRSAETEAAFQRFVFKRNLRSNLWGIGFGLFLFIIYVFAESIDSARPEATITIRITVFLLSVSMLAMLAHPKLTRHHDLVTAIVVTLMGCGMDLMIWFQPNLDNTYYIGIIQGLILFGLLLRLNYASMAIPVIATFILFVAIAFSKGDPGAAALQTANIFVVSTVCIVGVYFIQRYQREDFLKSQTIEQQNEQLKSLLDDVRKDNTRKLAAMNTLVHFVRTPLHQINGFSEIVMNSLVREDGAISIDEGIEGARYIKNATEDLSKSVNHLLTYHRLDESEGRRSADTVNVDDMIYDFCETIKPDIQVKNSGSAGEIITQEKSLSTALNSLAEYYNDYRRSIRNLTVEKSAKGSMVRIVLQDDGEPVDKAEFAEATKALTKLENYLTSDGSQMPMTLRTVARAAELCGGAFTLEPGEEGATLVLTVKNMAGQTGSIAGRAA